MKSLIALALVALVAAQDAKYTTKYDHINVEEVLKSDRLFKTYYNCLMDQGPCSPEGTELKQSLPEALENECAKCTERQRETGLKAINYLTENRPEEWAALKAKYDPDNKFVNRYRGDAEAAGIKL